MLVLSRAIGEHIWVGDDVRITIVKLDKHTVRLGIEAPAHVRVDRAEVRRQRERKGGVGRAPRARAA
jgi:carbon storage regulator